MSVTRRYRHKEFEWVEGEMRGWTPRNVHERKREGPWEQRSGSTVTKKE